MNFLHPYPANISLTEHRSFSTVPVRRGCFRIRGFVRGPLKNMTLFERLTNHNKH